MGSTYQTPQKADPSQPSPLTPPLRPEPGTSRPTGADFAHNLRLDFATTSAAWPELCRLAGLAAMMKLRLP